MKPLSPRQAAFVEGCLTGLSSNIAARNAGYSLVYSEKGAQLLRHPGIAAAIREGQMQIRERTLYTIDTAMDELDKAMAFAETHKSAMALSRLIEIRCKLNGLLVDRLEIKSQVDISQALLDAKARTGVRQIASISETVAEEHLTHKAHDRNPTDLFD